MRIETLLSSIESEGGVGLLLIAMLFFVAWGFAGRWILQNPHRVFPEDFFSKGGQGERIARFEITLVGTFMVFSGGAGSAYQLAWLIHLPELLRLLATLTCGVVAAVWVRKKLRQQKELGISPR